MAKQEPSKQEPSRSMFVSYIDYAKAMADYMNSIGFTEAAKYWERECK